MGFEKFVSTTQDIAPIASISKSGRISLNSQAVKGFGLEGYKGVVLYYDQENKYIGLKFLKEISKNEPGLIAVQSRKGTGTFFAALTFLNFYGIFTKATAYTAWFNIKPYKLGESTDEDKFFVIDLNTKRDKRKGN